MSIYFLSEHIEKLNASPGDYWYVYFRDSIPDPFVGVLSSQLWKDLFVQDETPDEETPVSFPASVEQLTISEVSVPSAPQHSSSGIERTTPSLSPEQAAAKEKNNKIKGNRAEDIALEIEKRRITDAGRPELVSKIVPVAKNTDGLGYDIRSINILEDGSIMEIFIEVKGTSGGINTPFHVSKRELEKSRELREAYYLYRIFNISNTSSNVEY